jgi:hypothetical protein
MSSICKRINHNAERADNKAEEETILKKLTDIKKVIATGFLFTRRFIENVKA